MKFVYLDPGLYSYGGHHATFCWHLTESLRKRGHVVEIYGSRYMTGKLPREWNVQPVFRANPYTQYFPEHETELDPICGWLKAFETSWQATLEDLGFLSVPGPNDIIYWASAFPAQLVALIHWLKKMPTVSRPRAIVELNLDSGVIVKPDSQGIEQFEIPDPRVQDRPMLWRYAGMLLRSPELHSRLKLMNFEPSTTKAYEYLLRRPVEAWSAPLDTGLIARSRAGKKAFAIGILGYQREEKGFLLVPELVKRLLLSRQDIAVLVQNSDPDFMAKTQNELRQLAESENRLVLWEGPISPKEWPETVTACDLIVCPYDPVAFRTRCSGMLNESLANAIPVVVPANTSLASMFNEFGAPGAVFEDWDAGAIAKAVNTVLESYDKHAEAAFEACMRWREERSVDRLADRIFEWEEESKAQEALALS